MARKMRRNGKNAVTNVRVIDSDSGTDGAYVDRCISTLQNSHSAIVVLCSDYVTLNTSSAVSGLVAGTLSFANIRLMDEFASMAGQYDTFRVRAIKYDVYDINQGNPATNAFSTFHDVAQPGSSFPPPPLAVTIDGPDAKNVPPGQGRQAFYWRAKGTLENEFQSTDVGGSADFGGLRYGFFGSQTSTAKFQIITRAIVDFRGRS